jgi:hypothetical protein
MWTKLAADLIQKGAPTLGQIVGKFVPVPFADSIATWGLQALARAMGATEATPEAVEEAMGQKSAEETAAILSVLEKEAVAKYTAMAEIAKAQADVGVAQVVAVNESIRMETNARVVEGDGLLGKWRGFHAWELTMECLFWAGMFMYAIMFGGGTVIQEMTNATPVLMMYFGSRFGVLGVHTWSGSQERQAAINQGPVDILTRLTR